MEIINGQLCATKGEQAFIGAAQIGIGAGVMKFSSNMVKKGSWGKTTGNIVNILALTECAAGVTNLGRAAYRAYVDKKDMEQYNVYEAD